MKKTATTLATELPFTSYPKGGLELLSSFKDGAKCSRISFQDFILMTRMTKCAYCGLDFFQSKSTSSFNSWLTMSLDHVIPKNACSRLKSTTKEAWIDDASNLVLSCMACNNSFNRYSPDIITEDTTREEFLESRNQIFILRRQSIIEKRKDKYKKFCGRFDEVVGQKANDGKGSANIPPRE